MPLKTGQMYAIFRLPQNNLQHFISVGLFFCFFLFYIVKNDFLCCGFSTDDGTISSLDSKEVNLIFLNEYEKNSFNGIGKRFCMANERSD
jgi:hypothetical protein